MNWSHAHFFVRKTQHFATPVSLAHYIEAVGFLHNPCHPIYIFSESSRCSATIPPRTAIDDRDNSPRYKVDVI
jgi:hypothetical protein